MKDQILSAVADSLRYDLIRTEDDIISEGDSLLSSVYSILIVKINARLGVEYRFFYDVSRSRQRAQRLLELLKDNHVMPAEADLLMEDLLAEM